MKRIYFIVLASFMLFSCATAYRKTGIMGGFSETRLADNIFQVSFKGNGFTNPERASDFSLLRSAELALQNGFRYFVIIDAEKSTSLSAYTTPRTTQTTANVYVNGNQATGTATTYSYGGQTYLISKPRARNTILCFKEMPETGDIVLDAEYVKGSIRTKYRLPSR